MDGASRRRRPAAADIRERARRPAGVLSRWETDRLHLRSRRAARHLDHRADGGTPRKVADVSPTGGLSWSPDGKRVVYAAGDGGWPGLWSVSVENGQVHRIETPGAVSEPAWNPGRDLIAYLEPATSGPPHETLVRRLSGTAPIQTLPPAPAISGGFANGMPAWSPDGRRLAVVSQNSNSPATIWIVDPESATPFRKLAQLPVGPRIRGVSWTRDGAALIIGQHDTTSDIVLLDQGR